MGVVIEIGRSRFRTNGTGLWDDSLTRLTTGTGGLYVRTGSLFGGRGRGGNSNVNEWIDKTATVASIYLHLEHMINYSSISGSCFY
jgi:hypothetical protein